MSATTAMCWRSDNGPSGLLFSGLYGLEAVLTVIPQAKRVEGSNAKETPAFKALNAGVSVLRIFMKFVFFIVLSFPHFFLYRGLGGGEAGDRDAERRAGDVVESDLVAELY